VRGAEAHPSDLESAENRSLLDCSCI